MKTVDVAQSTGEEALEEERESMSVLCDFSSDPCSALFFLSPTDIVVTQFFSDCVKKMAKLPILLSFVTVAQHCLTC